jgi:hypothetical protein
MNIRNREELSAAIMELENRKVLREQELVNEFKAVRESLHPVNLIKESFSKFTESPALQNGLLKTVVGMSAGFLSKKIIGGKSTSLLKKLLNSVIEIAVAKTAVNNTDRIKALGISAYNNLFKKKRRQEELPDKN